jgi:methionyl-tRNA formyltransferase
MAFQRLQRLYSGARIEAIKRAFGLDSGTIATEVKRMGDVNSEACRSFLREQRPSVVLVMGTRLIEEAMLRAANAPFVNYHAGITPKYRGVHGAYWARAKGDAANCGVTIHLIDKGIDTGAILYQARIVPEREDNFSTYPYLQLAAGLPLLARAGEDASAGRLAPIEVDLPSKLWSHPTLWSYLAAGLGRGAW